MEGLGPTIFFHHERSIMRQKKNRKRAISLFLVLTMLASLIPSNFVMAAETHEEPEVLMEEVSEEPTTGEVSPDTTEEAPV